MNPKTKNKVALIATIIMSLLFLGSGGVMLFGGEDIVKQFAAWGYPKWFPTIIGGLEVAGAIGLFIPPLRSLAIYGLMGLMVGAIYTHVVKEGIFINSVGPVVVMLLGSLILYLRRVD